MKRPSWLKFLKGRETVFVLFSGGKDSSAALVYTKELLHKFEPKPCVTALHVDTTAGLPDTQEFVEKFCRRIRVKLKILKPRKDYFTLVRQWGVPRPRARWCCFHLKIEPIRDYLRRQSNYIVLDGIRRQESRKRANYPVAFDHPYFGLVVHPIIDWSEDDVNRLFEERKLPVNPAYELGFSSWECWCGVYKRKCEFEQLKKTYPDFFMKLVKLEKQQKSGFAYAYFNGQPFYLRSLLDKKSDLAKVKSG